MNSIEKSEDLYKNVLFILQKHDDKFLSGTNLKDLAKELAINTVDEIIKSLEEYDDRTEEYLKNEYHIEYFSTEKQNMDGDFRYWDKVLKCLKNK